MIFEKLSCKTNPFSEGLSQEELYAHSGFTQALESLEYLPELGDLATLTARTGLGKTTIVKVLMERWRERYDVYYLHLSQLNATGLFRALLRQLNERPQLGKDRMFAQLFSRLSKQQRPLCLLIDEVQLMDSASMTDLRLLSGNLDLAGRLKVVLSGQPAMKATLESESMTDFKERLVLEVSLKPMELHESIHYLQHRLQLAGGQRDLFEEGAFHLIGTIAEGVPRRLNHLAMKAMLHAVQKDVSVITEMCVREALSRESL